jgi:putative PIN family toxin of toxin-antitoxin system
MAQQTLPVAIFDTGIVLQAILNPKGPAGDAVDLFDQGRVIVYISSRLRSELEDVLFRPVIRAKNPQVTDAQVVEGLQRLDTKAIRIDNPPPYIVYERDPNDEPVINLAIHVEANYIVSRDRDLLDLDGDPRFRQMFPFLRIVDPVTFVQELEQSHPQEGGSS